MIVSDKYRLIFLKTRKTAGTSIEAELSTLLEEEAIITPFGKPEISHRPRNYKGLWNPLPELFDPKLTIKSTLSDFVKGRKYYNHMTARVLRYRLGRHKWESYYKICVERDYITKTKSHINMQIHLGRCKSQSDYFTMGYFCINAEIYTIDDQVVVDEIINFSNLSERLKDILVKVGLKTSFGMNFKAKANINKLDITFSDLEHALLEREFSYELDVLARAGETGIFSQ